MMEKLIEVYRNYKMYQKEDSACLCILEDEDGTILDRCCYNYNYTYEEIKKQIDERAFYRYKMNEKEQNEANEIVEIANKCAKYDSKLQLRINACNPIGRPRIKDDGSFYYSAGGDCYSAIMAVESDNEFDYYIINVFDRGYFQFHPFREHYEKFYKNEGICKKIALITYLLRDAYTESNNIRFKAEKNGIVKVEKTADGNEEKMVIYSFII